MNWLVLVVVCFLLSCQKNQPELELIQTADGCYAVAKRQQQEKIFHVDGKTIVGAEYYNLIMLDGYDKDLAKKEVIDAVLNEKTKNKFKIQYTGNGIFQFKKFLSRQYAKAIEYDNGRKYVKSFKLPGEEKFPKEILLLLIASLLISVATFLEVKNKKLWAFPFFLLSCIAGSIGITPIYLGEQCLAILCYIKSALLLFASIIVLSVIMEITWKVFIRKKREGGDIFDLINSYVTGFVEILFLSFFPSIKYHSIEMIWPGLLWILLPGLLTYAEIGIFLRQKNAKKKTDEEEEKREETV